MTDQITPNTLAQMLTACAAQHEHNDPTSWGYGPTWEGDCQAFVHCMWGLRGGGFGSAYLQWLGLDPEDRLTMDELKGDLDNGPLGGSVFTKGSTPFGHTFPKSRPFNNGVGAGWSTDLWRTGMVGKVALTAPMTHWGHSPLGIGLGVNGYALDLTGRQPPKPKQNKRYARIERAHNNLGHSLDGLRAARNNMEGALKTARAKHDERDIKHFKTQIDNLNTDIQHVKKEMERLQNLYTNARHS